MATLQKKRLGTALVAGFAIAALVGCVAQPAQEEEDRQRDFVIGEIALPDTLDPSVPGALFGHVANELRSTLVTFDTASLADFGCTELAGSTHIKGELASEWSYSDDGQMLIFKLREGVKSAAGNVMTAADVEWSMNRALELSSSARLLLLEISSFEANPVVVIDDMTVGFKLNEPRPMDVALLEASRFLIYDTVEVMPHVTDADPWASEWLKDNVPTFGPWQLSDPSDWSPGTALTLTKSDEYWGPRGNVDSLVYRAIPQESTRIQLLQTGDIDYAVDMGYREAAQLADGGDAKLLTCVSGSRDMLVLNFSDERFGNPLVREAISLAIDREAINDGAYQGLAKPAIYGVNQDYDFPKPNLTYQFDLDKAKDLLTEAGYPDGFTMDLIVSPTRPGPNAQDIGVLIGAQLKELGITVNIQVVAGAADFSTLYLEGKYQAVIYQEPPLLADVGYSLGLYAVSTSKFNSFGYNDADYDRLTTAIVSTPAGPERDGYIQEISDVIVETNPLIYLADVPLLRPFSTRVLEYHHFPYITQFDSVDLVLE